MSAEEICYFISGYVSGKIPDYQAAALLMAIWFVGMDEQETAELTFAMRDSGTVIDLSSIPGIIADKHSTGGVADTTTLISAPIVAACGLKVAKISGRGLGHTGGTIDKLEAIPGFRTDIPMARFKEIVAECGLSVIGQTRELVPADRLLYALRDTTATVDNISLIASSIMSKKLASGSDVIVLDIKTGNGAFMQSVKDAEALAGAMVSIGKFAGKKIMALVTDMNQPLGDRVGNALEVGEAIEILQGGRGGRLKDVSLALASRMLLLAGTAADLDEAEMLAADALESGHALHQFAAMIAAHGGEPRVCQDISLLPTAEQLVPVAAGHSGYITRIETGEVGMAAVLLGAGRVRKSDDIDVGVGIRLKKRVGDFVEKGDDLAVLHVNESRILQQAVSRFEKAITITGEKPENSPLIYATIS